jgi:hypothetical protein
MLGKIYEAFATIEQRLLSPIEEKVTIMNTRNYPWRRAFLCAVFETDRAKMPAGISKARAAIEARLAAFPQPDSVECRAIEDAQRSLVTLGAQVSVLANAIEAPVLVRRPLR